MRVLEDNKCQCECKAIKEYHQDMDTYWGENEGGNVIRGLRNALLIELGFVVILIGIGYIIAHV